MHLYCLYDKYLYLTLFATFLATSASLENGQNDASEKTNETENAYILFVVSVPSGRRSIQFRAGIEQNQNEHIIAISHLQSRLASCAKRAIPEKSVINTALATLNRKTATMLSQMYADGRTHSYQPLNFGSKESSRQNCKRWLMRAFYQPRRSNC